MTPSLPTLSIAFAMILPISSSWLALHVATCAISLRAGDRGRHGLELLDDRRDGAIDAALDLVRVRTRGDVLQALGEDGLGVDGRGGGAVTGLLAGLRRDLLDHLRAHVLVRVVEGDLLRDRHAVLGDGGGAEGLLEDDHAPGRAQSDLDGPGEFLHALEDAVAGVGVKGDLLRCHIGNLQTGRSPRVMCSM
jgi:hypothetical protein